MIHPKYQVRKITVRKNVVPQETLDNAAMNGLMPKCEAERVARYFNAHDAVFSDDYDEYYVVSKYNK